MNEEYAALVTALPLFKGYTIDGAERILDAGDIREVKPGEVLMKEGDPPAFVLLILKGKVEVYVEREGKDMVLHDFGPSTIVGELAVLCGMDRSASVRVIEDSTILQWEAKDFRGLLLKDVFLSERIFRQSLRTLIEKERSLINSLVKANSDAAKETSKTA